MPKKRVLVLLSSYNGEQYISEQIESIMQQQGDFELSLLVRDDGSVDGTLDILRNFAEKYVGRITCLFENNLGYNGSFIKLLNVAKDYDYYAFSDQDDVWMPDKIECALRALDKEDNSIPLLYASQSLLVMDDMVPRGKTRAQARAFTIYNTLVQNICPGHTQVFNDKLLKILQCNIDASKLFAYDMWVTNVAMLYGKICFENQAHVYYRQHQGNSLGSGFGKFGQLMLSIRRTFKGDGAQSLEQISYFIKMNESKFSELGVLDDAEKLIKMCNAKFSLSKIIYALSMKFYRQTGIETLAFKIAVMCGLY